MNVRPCKAENAIKVVAFLFVFSRSFSVGEIEAIKSLHEGDRDEMPVINDIRSVKIQVGNQPAFNQAVPSEVVGITFSKITPSAKVLWSFTIQDNICIIRCEDYTRWDEVYSQAVSYIQRFIARNDENNILETIGLEYLDQFKIDSNVTDWSKELFRENSKYIPKYIIDINDYWHSHTGFFRDGLSSSNKILNRLNIDYVYESGRVINMLMQHHLNVLGDSVEIINLERIKSLFEELHDLNKEMLCSLLTNDVLSLIKLECKAS